MGAPGGKCLGGTSEERRGRRMRSRIGREIPNLEGRGRRVRPNRAGTLACPRRPLGRAQQQRQRGRLHAHPHRTPRQGGYRRPGRRRARRVARLGAGRRRSGLSGVPGARSVRPPSAPATVPAPAADDRLLVTLDPGASAATAAAVVAATGASVETRAGDTLVLAPPAGGALHAAGAAAVPGVRVRRARLCRQRLLGTERPALRRPVRPRRHPARRHPGRVGLERHAGQPRRRRRGAGHGHRAVRTRTSRPTSGRTAPASTDAATARTAGTRSRTPARPADDSGPRLARRPASSGPPGTTTSASPGVAQRVSLMPLKMLDAYGNGYVADAVEAIDFALSAKSAGVNLRVLHASWGTEASSVALSAAIGRANAAGVLFVAAAGQRTECDRHHADGSRRRRATTSTRARTPHAKRRLCRGDDEPGHARQLLQLGRHRGRHRRTRARTSSPRSRPGVVGALNDPCYFALYCEFNGTSMAAPMVSGAAVDVLAAEPALTMGQLRSRLLSTAAGFAGLDGLVATGRLDVCAAIPNCGGLPAVPPTKPNDGDRDRRQSLGEAHVDDAGLERQLVHRHRLRRPGPGRASPTSR